MINFHIQHAENVKDGTLCVRRRKRWNEMSEPQIGDRVEIVGEIANNLQSSIGVVTAIRKEFFGSKFTVLLADGTESVFGDSQLEIPPIIFADMIFDTRVSPAPELRGSTSQHHMRFICREFDIHLKLSGSKENKNLYGQVTANGTSPGFCLITLLFDSDPYATSTTDSGEFKLDQIPSGKAMLEIMVPSRRIVATFQVPAS